MIHLRRNYVLRLGAVTALCLIAAALAWANFFGSGGWALGHEAGSTVGGLPTWTQWILYEYGWPWCYRTRWFKTTSNPINPGLPLVTSVETSEFHTSLLACNFVVALAILGSTTVALEIWLRKPRLTQVRLKTVLILISVVSILLVLYTARDGVDAMLPGQTSVGGVWSIPIYLKIPISIGIACILFIAISQVLHVIGGLVRIWRLTRHSRRVAVRSPLSDGDLGNLGD